MKPMSRIQFYQRVARHRTPAIPAEVQHTCADDELVCVEEFEEFKEDAK